MSILDSEIVEPSQTVAHGANILRRLSQDSVNGCAENLTRINNVIERFGKAELVAELGDDAVELTTIYRACRTFVNAVSNLNVSDIK